ncbi:hypothetical protein CSPX01_03408 [Colletotrichum filicis]|nr:hypothetical protein CSPX01_03408 [Colletotrichum filicis]
MLPAKVQSEVRNFLTTTKAMLGLTTTVKTAFSVGFKFTDDDSVPEEEASNLSESLWLQGTYSLDSIRIQVFMENQEFFKAVSDDIRAKGIVGSGLGQALHKIEVSPKTCKALHELFIRGRKAYLRDLKLIGAVDYWMRFFEQDDEVRRGVTDDNEMFTVFHEVAL